MNVQEKMQRYAALVVEVGVNVQQGQTLVVTAPIQAAPFVRLIARRAYEVGAKDVYIEWSDDEITRIKYELAPDEAFHEYPAFRAKGWEQFAEHDAAFLTVIAPSPDLLNGIDPERISNANKAKSKALSRFRSYGMSNKISWSIVAVPTKTWAAKVFPDVDEEHLIDSLWEAIFDAVRIHSDNPNEAWRKHLQTLHDKASQLNARRYRALQYRGDGTDLRIELPREHLWVSDAGNVNAKGIPFVANIPSEEIWTAPLKEGVFGTVRSTRPLSWGGKIIKDASFTFDKGKIVDIQAVEGLDVLKKLIATDEGAAYLGEVALVPHRSPISDTGLLFYHTLFDENAACHLAIGSAYPFCLEGGSDMAEHELDEHGLNTSLIHVDFMIGSAAMDIDGELADGSSEPLFRKGNWAF